MTEALHLYEPTNQSTGTIWLAIFIFIASSIGAFMLFRQKNNRTPYTNLGAMLVGFVAMIALCTAVFSWWAFYRIATVQIYTNAIQIGNDRIDFATLNNAEIRKDEQKSFVNPMIVKNSVLLMLIEQRGGKTYVLSSEHYPVTDIMRKLKAAVTQWETK